MDLSLRSIRKNIAALSVFALIASMLVVTNVANAAAVDVYDDVTGGEWYEADVDWGLDNGVLDDTQAYFRAGDDASRAEFFTMVARGAAIPEAACDETLFPDLSADHWGCGYLTAMADAGIVSGDGAGSENPGFVRPDDPVLRAEAAKVIVESYGLTGTTLGSDVFTDVELGAWFDSYMGIANENCVFRGVDNGNTVEPARKINRAESVVVVQRGANPTTDCAPVVEAGALTVSLDGSTPDAAYIPKNGANIPYAVFEMAASADEAVNVEQLVITREGLGLPSDFQNVKIYVDGVQKGSEKTINTTTNTATFNLSSDPIEVPAGSSVLVSVRADMNAAATIENSQNQLCVASADDVLGYGADSAGEVSVGGTFAICGEAMTTTSATVGTLTYTVSQPSTADIDVGDTDVIMTKVRMDIANEDVEVERVTFKQTGSADQDAFGNVSLWMSGSMYADNPTWDGDYVTFDLAEDPIAIAKGNTKTLELHTDVVGGLASTANFDIYRDWHIEGTGQVYGYGVNVTEAGASATPTPRNIIGGNVAFSLSSNNPVTGDVKKGANDHYFTRFNVSTGGDGVTVRKLSLTVNANPGNTDVTLTNIDDVKIWTQNSSDEWYVVAGPNDFTAGTLTETVGFTDSFDVPAGTTQEFIVSADIANGATATDQYDIDVANVTNAANTELEYLSDGTPLNVTTDVTGGLLNGNVMTVNTPTLTIAGSATPGAKSYVRNTTDKDLVAYDMSASTADDLRVTGLVVDCGNTVAGVCSTAFQSLYLYEKDGSTLTQLDGPRSMSDLGAGSGNVTFSLNETIEAGSTKRFLVRADLASGAIADTYIFGATSVNAEDTDSSSAAIVGLPVVGANNVTVAANGNMSTQGVTDSSLMARLVAGLSADEPVLKLKFSADELEAWYVKKLEFDLTATGGDADVSKLNVDYLDSNGDPQRQTGTISGGTVQFEGLDIYVPAGSSQTVDISLDMGDVTPGGATAGDVLTVTFDGTAPGVFQAIGASSATAVTAAVDVTSNTLRLAKSYPMIARNELSTALSNGEKELYSVDVAAADDGDIAVKQLCFDVNPTAGLTLSGYKLYRNDESNDLATAGEVTVTSGALCGASGTGVLVQWHNGVVGGEDEIAAGTSNTYVLKATVAGAAAGESINTTLIGDQTAGSDQGIVATGTPYTVGGTAEAFVWSDLSLPGSHDSDEITAPTSADFLDGYLVDGLASAGGQVLSQ
ncbi:hypothetical protein GF369_04155 [Candidatus Peregrinibacteria bacterium]|nr:hypothetical protein [Candidatus Peregrinibacteria bacterium]